MKNMVGVSIKPMTHAIPNTFEMLSGTILTPSTVAISLLITPIRSLRSMIQPMAVMKSGMITTSAINVMKVLRKGSAVLLRSQASGEAKHSATKTLPRPTVTVLGITLVKT